MSFNSATSRQALAMGESRRHAFLAACFGHTSVQPKHSIPTKQNINASMEDWRISDIPPPDVKNVPRVLELKSCPLLSLGPGSR